MFRLIYSHYETDRKNKNQKKIFIAAWEFWDLVVNLSLLLYNYYTSILHFKLHTYDFYNFTQFTFKSYFIYILFNKTLVKVQELKHPMQLSNFFF
jgi:hypothetical protein